MPPVPSAPLSESWVEQVRASVADSVRRGRRTLREASAPVLTSVLAASALTPVMAAMLGSGDLMTAGVAVVGGVGVNVATNVIDTAIKQVRAEGGGEVAISAVEHLVAARIEQAFTSAAPVDSGLRNEIIGLFGAADIAGAALRAAADDEDLTASITRAFTEMSRLFGEFALCLLGARLALEDVRRDIRRQAARHTADRERARRTEADVSQILDLLRDVRPGPDLVSSQRHHANPYMGLAAFRERDAGVYFGRRAITRRLVGRLGEHLQEPGILLVLGPSGAGKSSLLGAGLMAAIGDDRAAPGSHAWLRRLITPTTAPIEQLAVHLAALLGIPAPEVRRQLESAPEAAHLLVAPLLADDDDQRLVLVVDQAEELFTSGDEEQARQFVTALQAMATGRPGVLVVMGLRSDFVDQAAAHPALREALERGGFAVGPMTESELREAITGPAARAGVEVPAELTRRILDDLRDSGGFGTGTLPLVSQVMFELWRTGGAPSLTVERYLAIGGVSDVVRTTAEETFATLSPERQAAAQRIFVRLGVNHAGTVARRVGSTRETLGALVGPDLLDPVLEAFTAKRLITLTDQSVEIAHEELLRSWPRLREWLVPEAGEVALHRALQEDADTWRRHHQDPSYLYAGGRLLAIDAALKRWRDDPAEHFRVGADDVAFVGASHRRERRRRTVSRAVSAVLGVLLVVAAGAAVLARSTAATADRERTVALSRQLAAQSRAVSATSRTAAEHLAATAWKLAPGDGPAAEAAGALMDDYNALLPIATPTVTMEFGADSRTLFTADWFGAMSVWDTTTATRLSAPVPHQVTGEYVQALALSRDGRTFVVQTDAVRIWKIDAAGAIRQIPAAIDLSVNSLGLSADGRTLATDSGGSIDLWDTATGRRRTALSMESAGALRLSPDGTLVAIANADGGAIVVDTRNPRHRTVLASGLAYSTLEFSGDGRRIAVAQDDGVIRLWDPRTGAAVGPPLRSGIGHVNSLALSPDGSQLVAGGAGGRVRRWNTRTAKTVGAVLTAGETPVEGLRMAPDGRLLATSGSDGTVRLWDLATGQAAGAPWAIAGDGMDGVWFSPDGTLALHTSVGDNVVRVVDLRTGRQVGTDLVMGTDGLNGASMSSDHSLIAAFDVSGNASLYDRQSRRSLETALPPAGRVSGLAFRPRSRQLAILGDDQAYRLWDVDSRRFVGTPMGPAGDQTALTFSPDGSQLAVVNDSTVQVWNLPATHAAQPLLKFPAAVSDVAFNPATGDLAVALADESIRTLNTKGAVTRMVTGKHHTGEGALLAFSPDGRLIVTSDIEGTRIRRTSDLQPVGAPATGFVAEPHFSTDNATLFILDRGTGTFGTKLRVLKRPLARYLDPLAALCDRDATMTSNERSQYAPGETLPDACGQ